MVKVEVILGIVASSIAITAFLARAIVNIRRGRRARKESRPPREIPPPQ